MADKTILFILRDAAKNCVDVNLRTELNQTADRLSEAIRRFAQSATEMNIQQVTGLWGYGLRLVKKAQTPPTNGGSGGALKKGASLAA